LRVFRLTSSSCASEIGAADSGPITADALPAIDGKPLEISNGVVFFTTNERAAAVHATESENSPGVAAIQGATASDDGRFVAFVQSGDVFVLDTATNSLDHVSVAPDGGAQNGESSTPSLSADGRFVVFVSSSSNLVAD